MEDPRSAAKSDATWIDQFALALGEHRRRAGQLLTSQRDSLLRAEAQLEEHIRALHEHGALEENRLNDEFEQKGRLLQAQIEELEQLRAELDRRQIELDEREKGTARRHEALKKQLAEQEDELRSRGDELSAAEQKLRLAQRDAAKQLAEVEAQADQLAIKKSHFEDSLRELAVDRERIDELEQKTKNQRRHVARELQAQRAADRRELEEQRAALAAQREALEARAGDHEEFEARYAELRAQRDALAQQVREQAEQIEQLRAQFDEQNQELDRALELIQQQQDELQKAEAIWRSRQADDRLTLDEATARCETLVRQTADAVDQLTACQGELAQRDHDLAAARQALARAEADQETLRSGSQEAIQAALVESQTQRESLERQLGERQQALTAAQQELDSASSLLEDNHAMLVASQDDLADALGRLEVQEQSLAQAQAQQQAVLELLQQARDEHERQRVEQHERVAAEQQQALQTQQELDRARRQIESLEASLAARGEQSAADVDQALQAAEARYAALHDENQQLHAERQQQVELLTRQAADAGQAQAQLAALRDELLLQQQAADQTLDVQLCELRTQLAQRRQRTEQLEEQLAQRSTDDERSQQAAAGELETLRAANQRSLEELSASQAEQERLRLETTEHATKLHQLAAEWESERQELLAQLAGAEADAAGREGDEETADLRRRWELALEDVRDLKRRNADLQHQLERAKSNAAAGPDTGSMDWESQKRRLLASLEADENTDLKPEERLSIQSTIRATETAIAAKDREIAELKQMLDQQSSNLGSIAVGAAAIEAVLEQDVLIQQERANLAQLQEEWRQKLREAEVDISVERARIARQRADIEQKLQTFEKERATGIPPGAPADTKKPQRGRWLSRLGLKDVEDDT